MPKIRKKYVATGNLNTDSYTVNPNSVVEITNQTANLSVGTNIVIVSSTQGYVPGASLTKTSGAGAFGSESNGDPAKIVSIDSPTQFTTSANHSVAGNISFSVGTPTSLIIAGPDIEYYGINNNIGGFVDRVQNTDGSFTNTFIQTPVYSHTLINVADPGVLQRNGINVAIPRYDSGLLNSNKSKVLQRKNSLEGTLPPSSIVTGKRLQSFNDPFSDINVIDFKELVSDTTFGVPLVRIKEPIPNTDPVEYRDINSYYMTTNADLISEGFIKLDSEFYNKKFNISETDIFDSPNEYHIKNSNRLVDSQSFETIMQQERFQEEYTPFTEDYNTLSVSDNSFYNETIDEEIKSNYDISAQKEIKIVIDFSNDVDLTLFNTKMSFLKDTSNSDGLLSNGYTTDDIDDLDYFNFVLGNNPKSYSSHFLPTAYWNFSKQRWNYLDGKITKLSSDHNPDDYNIPSGRDDLIPAFSSKEKYRYLGAKYREGVSPYTPGYRDNAIFNEDTGTYSGGLFDGYVLRGEPSVLRCFDFNADPLPDSFHREEIYSNFETKNFFVYANRPILTTPSFRTDGGFYLDSFQESGDWFYGKGGNKSPISKITGTYGFPYGITWQPQKEHMLKMSDYISNDFLVEKMIVKGKLTSKGEIAKKYKNVASGFTEFSIAVTNNWSYRNLTDLGLTVDDNYDLKKDYSGTASNNYRGYLANNLTFFILNERKGLNVAKNNINSLEKTQSYYISESFNLGRTGTNRHRNNILGKSLDNFSGNYITYYPEEIQQIHGDLYEGVDFLSVYSNIVPTSYIISSDNYNDLTFESNFFNKNYNLAYNENEIYHRSIYYELNNLDSSLVGSRLKLNLETNKNLFLYLNPVSVADPRSTNALNYVSELSLDGLSDRDHFYDTREYRTHDIVLESINNSTEHDLDQNRGRELVTYSNMLLLSKYQDHTFDESIFSNIDETKVLSFNEGEDLHINIDNPVEFEVKSFFKNIEKSDYTDESEFELKSNYRKTVYLEEPDVSEWPLQLGPSLNRIFALGSEDDGLFSQYVQSNYQPSSAVVPKVNSNNILFEFVNDANTDNGDQILRILGDRIYEFEYDLLIGPSDHNPTTLGTEDAAALASLVSENFSASIPCAVSSHFINGTFNVKTSLLNAESTNQKIKYNINFLYSNEKSDGTSLPDYFASKSDIQSYLVNNDSLKLEDFISYSYGNYQRNDSGFIINLDDEIPIDVDININLRFLDPFRLLGNLDKFYNYGFIQTTGSSSYYFLEELTNLQKEIKIGFETDPANDVINIWNSDVSPEANVRLKKKQHNLIKLVYIAFINAPVYFESGVELSSSPGFFIRDTAPGIPERSQVWQYLNFDDSQPEFITTTNSANISNVMLRYKETEFFPSHTAPYSGNGWDAGIVDKQQLITDLDIGITLKYRDYYGEKAYPSGSSITEISDPNYVFWNLDGHLHFGKEITYGINNPEDTLGHTFYIKPQVEASSQGAAEPASTITDNYNYVGILEGKNLGGPSNLGISSERIINKKEEFINTNSAGIILKNAGKILKEKDTKNYSTKTNYLLKPEDELVFGVSSNSNGEVLQSVVTLHDKIEITLIGRDYADSKKVKNNESVSIRKVVLGDNLIEKSGQIIQQTEGTYYDNIWNKNRLLNSFDEFVVGKEKIGQTSSGKFGSYTGLISFDRNYSLRVENNTTTSISTVPYYKLDTVHPSLGNVFLNCLEEKDLLYSVDNQDIYRFFEHKKNNNLSSISSSNEYNIPSYKIVLSDSITTENLANYPNRYNRIVYDWHEKYHLEEYKEFFLNDQNIKINDFSYDVIGSSTNYDSNSFIYFDINSFSAGLNYQSWLSFTNSLFMSNDLEIVNRAEAFSHTPLDAFAALNMSSTLAGWYQSLKTYCLPFSRYSTYQNAINLNNNLDEDIGVFKNKDIIIENNLSDRSQVSDFVVLNKYSIQYMLHRIKPNYTSVTDDIRAKLYTYGNDYGILDWYLGFPDKFDESFRNEKDLDLKSSWCLVFEITKSQLDSLIYNNFNSSSLQIFERNKITVQDNSDSSYVIHYYEEDIYLDISKNAGSDGLTWLKK